MAIPILVYGKSGSGKSRSLKNFKEDEIVLFNVIGKELPFKKTFRYEVFSDSYAQIKDALKTIPTDIAVIDDAGYLQTNAFMRGHSAPKGGGSTFDLFNQIGDDFWSLLMFIKREVPPKKRVYIMMHELSNDYGDVKLRTVGKLLDEKVCIEGMVTVCLRCMTDGKRHWFKTQAGSQDIAKSPEEMFPSGEIENDLAAVDAAVRGFYGL